MTFTKVRFASFEEYLTADPSDLPEGRCEYWDGELVPVMSESLGNEAIANFLYFVLLQLGVYPKLISPGKVQIVVNGSPKTRFPDLTVLDDAHLTLMKSSTRLGSTMPPPRLVAEIVSPGDENTDNYIRDYQEKRDQYAGRGISEYWLIDPQREWVMVGTLISEQYQFLTFRGEDAIVSPTFPEFKLTVTQILAAAN